MPRRPQEMPPLRPHKATGVWYVVLDGHRHYLGKDQAKAEEGRRRLLAERLLAGPGPLPDVRAGRVSVAEVVLACRLEANRRYSPGQLPRVRQALAAVTELYASTAADAFGCVQLDAVRTWLLSRPHQRRQGQSLSRNYVNRLVGVVQTLWAWAALKGLVPPEKARDLQLLEAVRKGQGGRETPRVLAVAPDLVERTLPACAPVVRAMIRVQQFTGMRPGEVCALLRREISTSPAERIQVPDGPAIAAVDVAGVTIWLAAPGAHKTSWKGKVRIIAVGPRAQAELQPYLGRPADATVFSPAGLPRCRRDYYTTDSYDAVLARACRKAGLPHWAPNQLRHAAGDAAANAFDQHHAQAVLGHSTPSTTSTYIDALIAKAAAVAVRLG